MSARFGTGPFERGGRRCQLVFGSDVEAAFLELDDITDPRSPMTVLYGEKAQAGAYRLLSLAHLAPAVDAPIMLLLDLVEDFIGWMKREL